MALTAEEQIELDYLESLMKRQSKPPAQNQMSEGKNRQQNSNKMNPEMAQDQGFLSDVAQSAPVQGILGFGDALSNMMSSSASTLSRVPNKLGLTDYQGIGYNPIKSGSGTAYAAGELAGDISPFVATGGLSLPARLGISAGTGYLFNPENSERGAAEGLGWGLAGEALGGIVPGAKYIKNKFTRENLVEDLKKPLQEAYEAAKIKAWEPVAGLFEEAKDFKFSPQWKKDVIDTVKQNETAYTNAGLGKLLDEFKKNPTLDSMQNMISQIGTEIRSLNPKDANNRLVINKLSELKDSLVNNTQEFLGAFDPNGAELYKEAMQNYAIGPGPFKDSKAVRSVLEGVTEGVTPKKIVSDLRKQGQREYSPGKEKLHPDHYLRETLAEAENKLSKSELYKNAAKLFAGGTGAAAGYSLFGPIGLAGGIAGQYLPDALKSAGNLLTNDSVAKVLQSPYAKGILQGLNNQTSNDPIQIDLMGEY